MPLGEQLDEILSRWQGRDIRRREGSLAVWDLGRPGLFARHRRPRRQAVAACRRELLAALLTSERPLFLLSPEPPGAYEVPGRWQPAGQATWLVPADFNPELPAVKRWLFDLGDWRLYRAARPAAARSPDVFRCSAGELLAWMRAQAVQALIESFHDDTDWVVAHGTA
jgi:hypothetical protein